MNIKHPISKQTSEEESESVFDKREKDKIAIRTIKKKSNTTILNRSRPEVRFKSLIAKNKCFHAFTNFLI